MTSRRIKSPSANRLWLLGLVLVAVAGVLVLKGIQSRAAVAAAPAPVVAQTDGDPMPADPAGQIEWAKRNGMPMMVLFRSTSCIPCKAMGVTLESVRADYQPAVVIITVLTDDSANLPLLREAGIRSIPTSYFVPPGGESRGYVGAMDEAGLRAELAALAAAAAVASGS